MRSSGLEIPFGLAISAVVFLGAMSWGRPFTANGSDAAGANGVALVHAQDQPAQPPQDQQAKSTTFTGTIAQDGEQFLLHGSSGEIYKLDDSERAKPFVGKSVKVTGQLDAEAKVIHVENIESIEA
jgi:hypothetical protein